MKRRLSDLFSLNRTADGRNNNNSAADLKSSEEKEKEVTNDDNDEDEIEAENSGLLRLKLKRDIKDGKLTGGLLALGKTGISSKEKQEQDPRACKLIIPDVAKDIKDHLHRAMEADDLAELGRAISKVNKLDAALHHIQFLQDSGMTILHQALERGKMKVAEWLIDNAEVDFLRQGYVNIDNQIPPSLKTSLHILCEIGDARVARKLLERLKTFDENSSNAPKAEVKKETPMGLFSQFTSKTTTKKSSVPGLHDKVVIRVDGEPRRTVECIHLAAKNGHSAIIRLLAEDYGVDVNSSDGEGLTALAWASKCGHVEVVKTLIALKAEVNQGNGYECAPLHWAAEKGHSDVVRALLKDAADTVEVNMDRIRSPRSPIEIAAAHNQPLIAKRLLKTGWVQNDKKLKALITASEKGHAEVVQVLLDNTPELLDESDDDGDTALLVAAEAGNVDVAKLLIELGADLKKKNYDRKTVFDLAMHNTDNSLLEYLMKVYRNESQSDDFRREAFIKKEAYYLHVAAAEGDVHKIYFLYSSGIDYRTAIDQSGNTFIHAAVENNRVNILDEFLSKYDDIINQQNSAGETPLHIAARKGFLSSVEKLIALRARLNIADLDGRTPLHSSVTSTSATCARVVEKIRDAVLASGTRILDEVDKSGYTALHLACKFKRADLIPELKLLNPECASKEGHTPLHVAAKYATVEVMKVLLDVFSGPGHRINIDRRDCQGATALYVCAMLGEEDKVELLVKRGADMALLDLDNASLLHRMIDMSIKTPTLADDMVRIYIIMVDAVPHWWARKKDMLCPEEDCREFHFLRLEGTRHLTSQIFYKGMNVLQYASQAGALMLMKEILNTPNVYKIMRGSPLTSDNVVGDAIGILLHRKDDLVGDHAGLILSTMALEKIILYDVTYLVPGNMPVKVQELDRYENSSYSEAKSSPNRKTIENSKLKRECDRLQEERNRAAEIRRAGKSQITSCLELIVNHTDDQLAVDLLDSEPFKILVKNYWHVCRRTSEAFMWIHAIFMICFTYFMIPTSGYMRERFHLNETNPHGGAKQYEDSASFHGVFLVWPVFILSYEIVCIIALIFRTQGVISPKAVYKANCITLSGITSGLMRFPMGVLLFCFNNLSHLSSLAFGISLITWYAIYMNTKNAHTYLESLAMAFVFGWLHTINYVKGFKDWNAFANILKQIILKDLTRFIYIYIFVLVSFGYAIHVLMIADYMVNPENQLSSTSTIYLTFYRMLSPGNVLDVSEDEFYKASGGSVPILRSVWAAYSCLSTVILMNLLIAMMNSTYSEVQSMRSTAWRVESLRMALWVERHMSIIKHFKIVHFNTTYDRKQDRWYLRYKPRVYEELEEDDDDGTKPASKADDDDEAGQLDHTDVARIIKESDDVERSVEDLKVEVKLLREELIATKEEERKTQEILVDLKKEMMRVVETCKEIKSQRSS